MNQLVHWIVCSDRKEFNDYASENRHQNCKFVDNINMLQAVRAGVIVLTDSAEDNLIYNAHADIIFNIIDRWAHEVEQSSKDDSLDEDISYGIQ